MIGAAAAILLWERHGRLAESALAGPASIRFTLCRGGPVYRVMCWMRFITPDSARIGRRVLLLIGVTWLPMLVLAAIGGLAFGDAVRLPFLRDITVYARFLVALPVFLVASKLVDERLELAVNGLASPDILPAAERPRFDAALRDLEHRRDWFVPEVLLLAIAVAGGFLTQQATLLFGTASWQALPVDGVARSTPAGRWLTLVATPILWFLIGRWLWRMLSWSLFLRRVSKLDLTLVPTHTGSRSGIGVSRRDASRLRRRRRRTRGRRLGSRRGDHLVRRLGSRDRPRHPDRVPGSRPSLGLRAAARLHPEAHRGAPARHDRVQRPRCPVRACLRSQVAAW
jgi:hypothetical protein